MKGMKSIRDWLSAERSSDDAGAETALGEIFALLSDPQPPVGFAAAVLESIDMRRARSVVPIAARWAIAFAMVSAALSLAVLPLAFQSLGGFVRVGWAVELVSATLVAASRALASWLEIWRSLAVLDRVLLDIVSKPDVAALLVLILAISLAALGLFWRLTAADRSGEYA